MALIATLILMLILTIIGYWTSHSKTKAIASHRFSHEATVSGHLLAIDSIIVTVFMKHGVSVWVRVRIRNFL